MSGRRRAAQGIFNLCLALTVLLSWLYMLFFGDGEQLSSVGLRSLRYYTVLSNIFAGAVAAVYGTALLRGRDAGELLRRLKLYSAGTVAVTFSVVVLFLGPLFGFGNMYRGANLPFHLIVPLAAALEYVFSGGFGRMPFRKVLPSVIPTALYGTVYLGNLLVNGVEGNDFYFFAYWGIGTGVLIFAAIVLLNLGLCCLLNACAGKGAAGTRKEKKPETETEKK